MSKWKVLFYFSFATLPATENKEAGGKILVWDTKEEAIRWATANRGPISFEVVEIKEGGELC